jgi:CBS domain-containing protein
LVNLVIAMPLAGIVVLLIMGGSIRSVNHLIYLFNKPSWQGFILNLFISNVVLAFFNLLPAFPMDGGRVLRSVLAVGMGQRRATRMAVRVGQTLAVGLGLLGLLTPNWVLVFIALFIFTGAQQEERLSEVLGVLGDLRVGQAMITACEPLTPEETLQSVLEHALHGHPACYGVIQGEQLIGLLTDTDITSALETYGHEARVRDVMRQEFPRVTTEDTVAKAWRLMATSGWRALPVVQDGRLLGMVTVQQIGEIYAFLAAKQRGQRIS